MMTIERELLAHIIGFVRPQDWHDEDAHVISVLVDNIKELLAQPEQEPVAWLYERQNGDFTERTLSVGFEKNFDGVTIPLYTSPPKREPLSDAAMMHRAMVNNYHAPSAYCRGFRDAEKVHGIGVDNEQ